MRYAFTPKHIRDATLEAQAQDRVFEVRVRVISTNVEALTGPVGTAFPNCYIFAANGDWSETGFPTAGFWTEEDSRGATTSYSVAAGPVDQVGLITPARGNGVVRLTAVTTLLFGPFDIQWLSVGTEIAASDAGLLCP